MAGVKISNLPAATTPLSGTESVPIVQGGVTVKVAASNFVSSFDIAALPAATTPLAGTESIPILQGGVTSKVSAANISSTVFYTADDPNAVTRTLSSKLGDLLTPQDFGAVGDGFTDDTSSWDNWYASYGSKYIPAGNYLTSGLLRKVVVGTFVDSDPTSLNYSAGGDALISTTSGSNNTAIGTSSLSSCTTGSNNTAIGIYSLEQIETFNNCTGLGNSSEVTASNQVQLGNSSTTTYAYGAVQNRSDARDKANVQDTILGLNFINALRPVDFKWDYREDYGWGEKDGSKTRRRFHHGLIAQEVKAACDAAEVDFGGLQDHAVNGGKDVMSIGYEELIAPMIKAIQELTVLTESLKAQIQQINAARNLQ